MSLCVVLPVVASIFHMQVLDQGVTRMLAHRLVHVYPYMSLAKFPKCGTCKAAFRVANRHFDFMGRRSQATTTPPGYVALRSLPHNF